MTLEILNETNEWIAINKPSGLLVEENPYEISVASILNEKYKYIGIVHRLDRVTSGILLVAKKKSALKHLNKQFSDRTVKKIYHAWVNGQKPKSKACLKNYLFKDQKNKIARIETKATKTNTLVALNYTLLASENNNYLLEIIPKTGKFHQIRAQLAHIGCPIVDDTKYNGTNEKKHLKRIALRASTLCFEDPKDNKKIELCLNEKFRYKN